MDAQTHVAQPARPSADLVFVRPFVIVCANSLIPCRP